MIAAFEKLESDIWTVAAPILDEAQQQELRERIETFHADNPELSTFSNLRFADFPSKRASSTLKKKKSGGIFSSVRNITDQVEQTRTPGRARHVSVDQAARCSRAVLRDIWVSRLSFNPAVEESSARTSAPLPSSPTASPPSPSSCPNRSPASAPKLSSSWSRRWPPSEYETIEQLFDRCRRGARGDPPQFIEEEQRLGGLLTELRHTLPRPTR